MHCILCIGLYVLYFEHCFICIVFYALYSIHCILCIVCYALYYIHCILSIGYMHYFLSKSFYILYPKENYTMCFMHSKLWSLFHTMYYMLYILYIEVTALSYMNCMVYIILCYHSLIYKQLVLVKGKVNLCQMRGTALCISDQTFFLCAKKSPDVVWEGKPNKFPNHIFFFSQ
jgi:hypothetical protein